MHNFYLFPQDPLSLYNLTPGTPVYTEMEAMHEMGDDLD